MKEYRLQTGAPENRAAKSTFPWKDKIGSSARISGISGNVWPGLILYIAILFINIVAKENFKYEKTYKSSAYRGFLSLNRCHIPDDPAPDNTSKEKSKEKQMPKKDSTKKTPENNKKDMPDTQSKVPPVEGNIPPAVQK